MICQEIKCKDYLTDEGEPAWCFMAGMPAQIAAAGCQNRENEKLKGSTEKRIRENKKGENVVNKLLTLIILLYYILFLGSSLPYERRIKPPVETNYSLYTIQEEPQRSLVPSRREVPEEYRSLFDTAAVSAGIPPGVLESIAFVESGFNSAAKSPTRENGQQDLGMFQFNSTYLYWYADTYNGCNDFDPLLPREAALVAAKHIRYLYDRYGHWPTVCLAYNAGMTAVDNDEIPDCSYRYLLKIYDNF